MKLRNDRHKVLIFCLILFICANSAGFADAAVQDQKQYTTPHFQIVSSMDPRYIPYMERNIEAFRASVLSKYFTRGFDAPLKIVYSVRQSETQKIFNDMFHGQSPIEITYGIYIPKTETVYTHYKMDDGSYSKWGTLFHEITHHFIQNQFREPPAWFNEGLASFFGEPTRIVNGNAVIGRPNPWREKILRDFIESGSRWSIENLVSMPDAKFYDKKNVSYALARDLFFWIYQQGKLEEFLREVEKSGYNLSVLERVLGIPKSEMDGKLLNFIKEKCYPGAFLYEGQTAIEPKNQEESFLESLKIDPSYDPARLALGLYYLQHGMNDKARETLLPIIQHPQSVEQAGALWAIADTYYNEGDFKQALIFYNESEAASEYDNWQYRIYFRMAVCYKRLGDEIKTKMALLKESERNYELEEGAQKNPESWDRYFILGRTYWKMNDYPNAIKAFHKGLELKPDRPELLSAIAEIYHLQSRMDLAIEFAEKSLAMDPTSPTAEIAYQTLGTVYMKKGDQQKAEKMFQTGVKINPRNPATQYAIGYLYLTQGRYAEAVLHIKEALNDREGQNMAIAYHSLGAAYQGLGRSQNAKEAFTQAVRLYKKYGPAKKAQALEEALKNS